MHVHIAIQEKGEPSISLVPRSLEMEVDRGSSSVLMCSGWIFSPRDPSCDDLVSILMVVLQGDVGDDMLKF